MERERHLADFIEKNGAAMGQLEAPFAFVGGAGEELFVPEKFALHEVLRQGRAVELYERAVFTGRIFVHGAGDQFLTGTVLTLDQHGGIGLRHAPDELTQLLGGRRAAKNFVLRILGLLLGEELVDIEHLRELLGFAQYDLHLFIENGLSR